MQDQISKLDEILAEMERRVEEDIPISPASWVESALRINALKGSLDNQLAQYQFEMMNKEADLIKEGMASTKANILAKQAINYLDYLQIKAKIVRIDQYIMLAKKRSIINEI
jgi:hypothetical protein